MERNLLKAYTTTSLSGCGNLHTTINYEQDGEIHNIVARCGKSGTCLKAFTQTICELLSGVLSSSIPKAEKVSILNRAMGNQCQYGQTTCVTLLVRDVMQEGLLSERK